MKKIAIKLNGKITEKPMEIAFKKSLTSVQSLKEALSEKYSFDCEVMKLYSQEGVDLDNDSVSALQDGDVIYVDPKGHQFTFKSILMQYEILSKIGQGGFSEVFCGKHRDTKELVAIKYMNIAYFMHKAHKLDQAYIEAGTLAKLKHPNIIEVKHSFVIDEHLILIMENATGGTLREVIKASPKGLPEPEVRAIMKQIVDALKYCHGRFVIHRDLKPENVVFASKTSKTCKLIDFGLASKCSKIVKDKIEEGTLLYMAPELFQKGAVEIRPEIDIWSVGTILYELVFGRRPFLGKTEQEAVEAIIHDPIKFPEDIAISEHCENLMLSCLNKMPDLRMSIDEIAVHPWFSMSNEEFEALKKENEAIQDKIRQKQEEQKKLEEEEKIRDFHASLLIAMTPKHGLRNQKKLLSETSLNRLSPKKIIIPNAQKAGIGHPKGLNPKHPLSRVSSSMIHGDVKKLLL